MGFFSNSNQKRLIGNDQDVPIFEAKLSRDLRIVVRSSSLSPAGRYVANPAASTK